jgi:ParB/RepB/Spo0J family partition protein
MDTKEKGTPELFAPVLLPVDKMFPSPVNKRKSKNANIDGLSDSIAAQGLLHAIHVRPHPSKGEGFYEIVTGERRWQATKRIAKEIPAIVRELTDIQAHEITVTENLQREDLTPLEEAGAIDTLLKEGKDTKDIADRLGRPLSWVIRRAKLVDLSPKWISAYEDEKNKVSKFGASHLEIVARFDQDVQDSILENQIVHQWKFISVDDLKEICDRFYMNKLSSAPWFKNEPPELVKGCVLCAQCQNRTSAQMNLFGDIESDANKKNPDRCIDVNCFKKKTVAFVEMMAAKLKTEQEHDVVLIDRNPFQGSLPRDHALKAGAVADHEVISAKKTDPKAQLALIIDGPGAGTTMWIRSSNPDKPVKGQEKTMADKRRELDKRRNNRLTGELIEHLEKVFEDVSGNLDLDDKDILILAIRLVTRFGSTRLLDKIDAYQYSDPWKTNKTGDAAVDLIRCVLPVIRKAMRDDQRMPNPDTTKAEMVCKWFQIDYKKLKEKITADVPEPKSWRKDGKKPEAVKKEPDKKTPVKKSTKGKK